MNPWSGKCITLQLKLFLTQKEFIFIMHSTDKPFLVILITIHSKKQSNKIILFVYSIWQTMSFGTTAEIQNMDSL
jgi:hypothetical protein